MNKFIVMSPCYETIRYPNLIKRRTTDAHSMGKFSKFIIGSSDLIDPKKGPIPENFRFEASQAEVADIVIYYDDDRKSTTLKGENLDK